MPLWTLPLLLVAPPSASTLNLYRGCALPGQAVRYWTVEDTVLESTQADGNFGGQSFISCGPGKTFLIRFGDLRRALGPNKKITKASLVLTITGGSPAPLSQASEVLVPWGEGPTQVVVYGAVPAAIVAPAWSATWKHRRAGEGAIAWQQPGATGVGDVKSLTDIRASNPDIDHVRIEGLAAAMQRQYERPYDFHGLAFSFGGTIELASSQNKQGRPVLELEYETETPKTGADLTVVSIVRTPEYPRYNAATVIHKAEQDGVEVSIPGAPANFKDKHWPSNGEEVIYTATIKNIGDALASGYIARWSQREKPGTSLESDKTLAPGESTTLVFRTPFRNLHSDHRVQPLSLEVEPKSADADAFNNALTIYEGGLSVGFRFVGGNAAKNLTFEASSPEEFAQTYVRLWNDVIFPQSRFSFAADGALERLRVQRVATGDGTPDPNLDIELVVRGGEKIEDLFRETGRQLGLADLSLMNIQQGKNRPTIDGLVLERFATDITPGILGGGDTRNEGFVPISLIPPYEPMMSPLLDALPMEATDLLSATDVGALNAALGHRRGFSPQGLFSMPTSLLLRVVDPAGNPIKNATVEIYAMTGGEIKAGKPIATVSTGTTGTAAIPARPTLLPEGFKTALGGTIAPSAFGRIDPDGRNGVLLLRVNAGGSADFGFVKAWQVADAYRRSPLPVLVMDVRVNIGGDVDRTSNLAKNRIVTDSSNMLPAKLGALVDESNDTAVELPQGKGAWVEIDLGRDRAFGEVRLTPKGAMWEQFSISAYATGQTASDAKPVVREASWSWIYANRSDSEPGEARSVAYRTTGVRARYLRVVRLSEGGPGNLAEIKVFPLRAP